MNDTELKTPVMQPGERGNGERDSQPANGNICVLGSNVIGKHNESLRRTPGQECEIIPPSNSLGSSRASDQKSSLVETDFAELKDGTLVELVRDPTNFQRTLLAVWKDGEVRYLDRLEQDDHVFIPLPGKNHILEQVQLPTEATSYESRLHLIYRLEDLISECVCIDETYLHVLADYVLSTWFVDRFSVALYLSIIGLSQSGKTTLLRILSFLCRRSLLIADITSASFYRVSTQFMPTLLIDETESIKNNRVLRHMLRTGTTRDVNSVVGNQILHSYGAKAISWLEPPDDPALNSRCVLIPMRETTRTNLTSVSDPEVKREAAILQAQMLRFRLENYGIVKPNPIPGDERLRPRSRDLLRVLSATHLSDNIRSENHLRLFDSGEAVPQEPLSPSQNAVLRGLFVLIHSSRKHYDAMQIKDLTAQVNDLLKRAAESLRLQPRKVGAALTSLGFSNRRRANSGWVVYLDRKDLLEIHRLAERYGIENLNEGLLKLPCESCDLCKTEKSKRPPSQRSQDSFDTDTLSDFLSETLGEGSLR